MEAYQQDQLIDVIIPMENEQLYGNLYVPKDAKGLVLFAHGSGSSRFSKRNCYVASKLNEAGLATLLFDLLTEKEEQVDVYTREFRFDIPMLAKRLIAVTDWVLSQAELANFSLGYFGSSTGAAAALIAAAQRADKVSAVVSRGGRPDLADTALSQVISPTLLIVGGLDDVVIELNQEAKEKMVSAKIAELVIVSGATHLFEETGKLDEVVTLVRDWFVRYL